MKCFITRTGSFLPGKPIDNCSIQRFIGTIEGEEEVKTSVLKMNGIKQRFYALDENQNATHDVYELASLAVADCLKDAIIKHPISYLSAGTTYAPYSGPGLSSILHGRLSESGLLKCPVEISSNSGICTSASTAMANACRAIKTGDHKSAICVGTEQATHALKSSTIDLVHDTEVMQSNLKKSKWFMSVFLRFMLSDGAGAFLLQSEPDPDGISFEINWFFGQSFAHEAPLCMTMENGTERLSQDVTVLSSFLFDCSKKFVSAAFEHCGEALDDYDVVLPHLSSFFFKRRMEKIMGRFMRDPNASVPYWTNLASAGNTGAASIFVMLDEYRKTQPIKNGDRMLLFIPESGQFNFMMFSLTVVCR